MNALRSGQVHALCHADPIMTLLEQKADTRIAGDIRSLKAGQEVFGGHMPASCLYAPQAFVQKNAAQAQALANGIVHALKWLQTAAPADLVKAVPAGYLMGDRGLYLSAFGRVRETYSTNGLMPEDGAAIALRALARVHPELGDFKMDLARTYTNDFVRKARQKFNV
jgi:NitT/TauT family transport system substrate-binding protein